MAAKKNALDVLTSDPRNARRHSARNLDMIAASLREVGAARSIVIDEHNVVRAGNGTLEAARRIGLSKLQIVDVDGDTLVAVRRKGLTPAQAAKLAVADNRTAETAEWDTDVLQALADQYPDAAILDGWTAEELDALFAHAAGAPTPVVGLTDPDALPDAPTKTSIKRGQVFELGTHRVMCGDSTDPDDVARLIGPQTDGRAALVHADPPYGMGKQAEGVQNDNLYREKLDAFQLAWWKVWRRHLADNGSAYIWGTAEDLWRLWYAGGLGSLERVTFRNEIVWDKGSGMGMLSDQHRQYPTATERCLFFMLGEQGFGNVNAEDYWEGFEPIRGYLASQAEAMGWGPKDIMRLTGVGMFAHWFSKSQWSMMPAKHYATLAAAAEGKAFAKPYPEISSAPEGADVLEPFLGSGTTVIAAEQTGRRCLGMELTPEYVQVVVDRWEAFTGKKARKVSVR